MSLKATILNAVEAAFTAAGDLVVSATIVGLTAPSFDWSSGSATGSASSVTADVIPYQSNSVKSSGEVSAFEHHFLIRSKDLPPERYTKIIVGLNEFAIESIERYEGVAVIIGRAADV